MTNWLAYNRKWAVEAARTAHKVVLCSFVPSVIGGSIKPMFKNEKSCDCQLTKRKGF